MKLVALYACHTDVLQETFFKCQQAGLCMSTLYIAFLDISECSLDLVCLFGTESLNKTLLLLPLSFELSFTVTTYEVFAMFLHC